MRCMKLEPITQSEVSRKEKHIYIYQHIYMEFRKMVMMTLYARQQKRHRCIEQPFGLCGRAILQKALTSDTTIQEQRTEQN